MGGNGKKKINYCKLIVQENKVTCYNLKHNKNGIILL